MSPSLPHARPHDRTEGKSRDGMVLVCEVDTAGLLWWGGVMPVKLAAAEEVVMHHASDQQEGHDG